MHFELVVTIDRSPADVFIFLSDKDTYPQEPDSPVIRLDKITPGPVDVETQYVEVVKMLPWVKGEIKSRITRYEPYSHLEEDFEGAGMRGHLAYEFMEKGKGTLLIQRETLQWLGFLKLFTPIIRPMLESQLISRLNEIKNILESGWTA